jgi:IS5 family transposase
MATKRIVCRLTASQIASASAASRLVWFGQHFWVTSSAATRLLYKSHISIDRRCDFIRAAAVTSANPIIPMGACCARSSTGKTLAAKSGPTTLSLTEQRGLAGGSHADQPHHRLKPEGKSMPIATARANAAKSAIRTKVEHVFAHQKNRFGLFIRTIGVTRADAKLTLANLAYNFDCKGALPWHESA